ncbi:50S ribosomal protein L35 [Rhodococcus hoagii]|nr:50S ribosomal protein L35 [Prescottella equi]
MPKSKTHSGTAKRFKCPVAERSCARRRGRRHLLEHKSSRVTRRLDGVAVVADVDAPRIKRLLGI